LGFSFPEWLAVRQLCIGLFGGGEHRVQPAVFLTSEQANGERSCWVARVALATSGSADDAGRQVPVKGDVVELAAAGLHVLERRSKRFTPPCRPREDARVKVEAAAHLLGLDPQLVPAARIELGEVSAPLADLLPALGELSRSRSLDRHVASFAHRIIAGRGPFADLEPAGHVQHQAAEAFGANNLLRLLDGCRTAVDKLMRYA